MLRYRVELTPDDNDTLLVTCPDIPGVVTYGETREDALWHAVDAIETMLASMIDHGETVALPHAVEELRGNEALVTLPLLTSLKTLLHVGLIESGVTRAELARRLGWQREQVDRLLRLDHASRVDQIEAAFRAIGREITVETRSAA